jgi:glycosyltransferase involved in cell wall biosynthesis
VRILALSDSYVPESAAPAVRLAAHAKAWLAAGHEVTVVTGVPNFPQGRVREGYVNRPYQEEWIDGVRVIRVGTYISENSGTVRRALDYASFMVAASVNAWRYPRADVILATSPPLLTAAAGYAVSRALRTPWVFEVRDLWPASIRAVGAGDGVMLDVLERLELFLYGAADHIVLLTTAFEDDLASRGVSRDRCTVATNGVDLDQFDPAKVGPNPKAMLGLPEGKRIAGYVGTTGLAHGLGTLLDAAERTADRTDLLWLVQGEGAQRRSLEEEAGRRGLDNVLFRNFVPHAQMPAVLAAIDVSVVHLRPDPVFETVIPSKIFEAMAMGTPIVLGVRGEAARRLTEAGAGVCVAPGDPDELAGAVVSLIDDPERGARLGEAGQEAVAARYNRTAMAQVVLRALERARANRR